MWRGKKAISFKCLSLTLAVAFLFITTYIPSPAQAQTVEESNNKVTPVKQFQATLEETEELLEDISEKLDGGEDVTLELDELKAKKQRIESLDQEIEQEFIQTEQKLKAAGLPGTILQRHYDFVARYNQNMSALLTNLNEVENAKLDRAKVKEKVNQAKEHIKNNRHKKKYIPLDPNKLPQRGSNLKARGPLASADQFNKLYAHTESNSVSPQPQQRRISSIVKLIRRLFNIPPVHAADSGDASTDPNLTETIDVQITSEVKELAKRLNHNPVEIYSFVKNSIHYVPTYGSRKGSQETLREMSGNSFDQASFLIALLRASDIPARYVYGRVIVPIETMMNMLGVKDRQTAGNMILTGGIPAQGRSSGGVLDSVVMEHIWVEAYVDMLPSRGINQGIGRGGNIGKGDTWIPLDPSFKTYEEKEDIDVTQGVPIDPQIVLDTALQGAATTDYSITNLNLNGIESLTQTYIDKRRAAVQANYPEANVFDILGGRRIVREEIKVLPTSLPYKVGSIFTRYSELPGSLRYRINYRVINPDWPSDPLLNYTLSTPEIAGKRVTLTYFAASDADKATLASYARLEDVPAYLVEVVPVLRVDGKRVATGSSVGLGTTQYFYRDFIDPTLGTQRLSNTVTAGGTYAMAVNLHIIPPSELHNRFARYKTNLRLIKDAITSPDIASRLDIVPDDIFGEFLYLVAASYFTNMDTMNRMTAAKTGVRIITHPSEAIGKETVAVSYLYGFPSTVKRVGLNLDADLIHQIPFSITGDPDAAPAFMLQSGVAGSIMESEVFAQAFGIPLNDPLHPAVSAIKILNICNTQGIPIYIVDSNNINQVLPLLNISSEVKEDVQNSAAAGKTIYVPQQEINYYGWVGTGYVVIDPVTGEGAYLISGGTSGGELTFEQIRGLSEDVQDASDFLQVLADSGLFAEEISEILGEIAGSLDEMRALVQVVTNWAKLIVKAIKEGHANDPMVMEPLVNAAVDVIVGRIIYHSQIFEQNAVNKTCLLITAYSATVVSICELTQSSLSQGLYEEYIGLLQNEFIEAGAPWSNLFF